MDFIGEVRGQLHAHSMVPRGSRVLAAVSGGPDSMAMLHALARLRRAMGFTLHVAHVDHGLRKHSARDLVFVKRQARLLGLPFSARVVAVAAEARRLKRSIEETARHLRYEALHELAREAGCDRIATGHTLNDQAETVLMRVIAGTGLDGLAGIRPVRREASVRSPESGVRRPDESAAASLQTEDSRLQPLLVVRPLLNVTRGDVEAFLKKEKVPFVVDETNANPKYDRNRLRRVLLPLIEREFNPSAVRALARLAENARAESEALDRLAADAVARSVTFGRDGKARLTRAALNDLPEALRARVLDHVLRKAAPGARFDRAHLAALGDQIARGTGTSHLSLPGGLRATVTYTSVEIHPLASSSASGRVSRSEMVPQAVSIPGPGSYEVPWLGGAQIVFGRAPKGFFNASFDMRVHRYPFTVRTARPGDRIGPPLYPHTKKVQDVPREVRGLIPLVCCRDEVLWVVSRTHPRPASDPRLAIVVSLDIPADALPWVETGTAAGPAPSALEGDKTPPAGV